jgi:hypothetical protein
MERSVSAAMSEVWYSSDSHATDKIKNSPLPGIEPGSPA